SDFTALPLRRVNSATPLKRRGARRAIRSLARSSPSELGDPIEASNVANVRLTCPSLRRVNSATPLKLYPTTTQFGAETSSSPSELGDPIEASLLTTRVERLRRSSPSELGDPIEAGRCPCA